MSDTAIDPRYATKAPKRPLRLSWGDERVRGIVYQIVVVGIAKRHRRGFKQSLAKIKGTLD